MPRRCFIAAPGKANLNPVTAVLEARGWETFALADVARLGASLGEAVADAIRSADVVVAILDDSEEAEGTIFEVGLAAGMGKPVLILASSEARVPVDLRGFLQVRASPDNAEAIALALDNFERYEAGSTGERAPRHSVGRPLGPYADHLLEETREGELELSEVEELLVRAVEASGAVASGGVGPRRSFDIGVWSDDLDAIAGNPLLVEVRPRIDSAGVRNSLLALHRVSGARAALIVALEEPTEIETARLRWPVLGISLRKLLEEMRDSSFAEVVRELRNRSVHGQLI